MKRCRTCRIEKELRHFYPTTSGHEPDCYPCKSAKGRKSRKDAATRLGLLEDVAKAASESESLTGALLIAIDRLRAWERKRR